MAYFIYLCVHLFLWRYCGWSPSLVHARQTIHTSPHSACRVLQSHANFFALLGKIREVDGGGCGTLCGPHLSLQKCGGPRSGLSPRQKWAVDRQKGAGFGLLLGLLPSEASIWMASLSRYGQIPSVSPDQAYLRFTPSPQTTCC